MKPIFDNQPDDNVKIWRYMDFTKFMSLIESSKLFFSSGNNFEDPFEGVGTLEFIKLRTKALQDYLAKHPEHENGIRQMELILKFLPNHVAITCWHENEFQSAAMWKLYLSTNEGIAIQTTYGRLKESITDRLKIQFGRVKYKDIQEDLNADDTLNVPFLLPFAYKRKSFEHEKEIRGLYWEERKDYRGHENGISPGIGFDVDLKVLIEKIYIAPTAPVWFGDLVTKCFKKYGYDFLCEKSDLYDRPALK